MFSGKTKVYQKDCSEKKKRMEESFSDFEYKKWIYGMCSFYLLNQR
jgi:hypothetical protein